MARPVTCCCIHKKGLSLNRVASSLGGVVSFYRDDKTQALIHSYDLSLGDTCFVFKSGLNCN